MQQGEILEIGRQLKVRRKMRELLITMRNQRPTLSPDTLYRAFNEPGCDSELLWEIRQAGKRLLENMVDAALVAA